VSKATWSELISHWFAETLDDPATITDRMDWWFSVNEERDRAMADRFSGLVEDCAAGHLRHWLDDPEGRLAMIIALDQLPRNLFRGTARAFSHDAHTAALCLASTHTGQDRSLKPIQRAFLYMPLQHFEDRQAQEAGVQLYEQLAKENPEWPVFAENFATFARLHRDIISRFGRFPHRNKILNRESAAEEAEYLAGDTPRFGQ
jgi:uncharacterized protein (DUF924 family)